MPDLATIIELSKEEAQHLGYSHNDLISVTTTENGLILYKKSAAFEADEEYEDKPGLYA